MLKKGKNFKGLKDNIPRKVVKYRFCKDVKDKGTFMEHLNFVHCIFFGYEAANGVQISQLWQKRNFDKKSFKKKHKRKHPNFMEVRTSNLSVLLRKVDIAGKTYICKKNKLDVQKFQDVFLPPTTLHNRCLKQNYSAQA